MPLAHFALAIPDDPDLLARIGAELAAQSDPPIAVSRSRTAVLAFASETGEMMLRSRVVQALEAAAGPDWQQLIQPLD